MRTTLIAATLNEIEAVQAVLPQIKKDWVDQIIIADGGSTDGTVEFCEKHGYQVVRQRGRGYGAAIQNGLEHAVGDLIIEFPPDGNSLAERIPALIAELHKGYDFVIVSRYKDGARSYDDDFMTAIGNRMFTRMANILLGISYTDLLVGFRGYRRNALAALSLDAEGLSFPVQEAIRFACKGYKIGEIPGDEPKRIGGKRKMRIFKTGWEILTLILREYRLMRRQKGEALT